MDEMTNSRQKGARGEREIAKILRQRGYDARRGQQYCGINGDADVIGLPGVHIEVKRVEALNIGKAMLQAENDRRDDKVPAVFHRKNAESWKVTMWFDDWINMYEKAQALNVLIDDVDLEDMCNYMIDCGDWCGNADNDDIAEIEECKADMTKCYVEYLKRRKADEEDV